MVFFEFRGGERRADYTATGAPAHPPPQYDKTNDLGVIRCAT
jgi:hypothetical protein